MMNAERTNSFAMTIGGEVVPADGYTEIRNPANTEEIVGYAPVASPARLDRAVAAAAEAFVTWRRTPDRARADACRAIARVVTEHARELAALLTAEQGKALAGFGSRFELQACAAWAARHAEMSLAPEVLEENDAGRIVLHREPLGVVACITPWNWPLLLAMAHILPAVRTGNTVVVKPSPYTPLGTLRMVELMARVLPPGVVNVVSGGDRLGAALTEHPGVAKIAFTGSIDTGRKVMAAASRRIRPLTLELGGNDPAIILPGTAIAPIVERLFWGAMINSGQTCGAIKRLYVHRDDYRRVCQALVDFAGGIPVGDGRRPETLLGPIQNEAQFDRVCALVAGAEGMGGRILTGGNPPGGPNYFYPVTIIADIQDGVPLVDEEQFGPALPVIPYDSVADAVARANGTEFGLCASVWGDDAGQLADVAARLEAGTVFINKHAEIAPHVPLAGTKSSGLGAAFGLEGLKGCTAIKVISARHDSDRAA